MIWGHLHHECSVIMEIVQPCQQISSLQRSEPRLMNPLPRRPCLSDQGPVHGNLADLPIKPPKHLWGSQKIIFAPQISFWSLCFKRNTFLAPAFAAGDVYLWSIVASLSSSINKICLCPRLKAWVRSNNRRLYFDRRRPHRDSPDSSCLVQFVAAFI